MPPVYFVRDVPGPYHSKGLRVKGLGLNELGSRAWWILALLFAETAEKRDGVAEHGVVGAWVLHRCV